MAEKPDQSFDGLPSYSESVSTTYSLPKKIAQARTTLISTLISSIRTHLHNNALSGLSNTTLVVVPSNVSQLQASHSDSNIDIAKNVVGFPSTDNIAIIHLQGQENNLGFWCQPAVVPELEQQLCSQLQHDGYRVIRSNEVLVPKPKGSGSAGAVISQHQRTVDWRTVQKKSLESGEAAIEAQLQEVSVRSENLIGLYETRTGKALVIKVEIG